MMVLRRQTPQLRRQLSTSLLRRQLSTLDSSRIGSRIGTTFESFFTPAHRVVVSVPATTSNLGPGFDSFGLALELRNRVVVERADEFSLEIFGEGEAAGGLIDKDESNVVVRMCHKTLQMVGKAGAELPKLRFECHNAVPCQRGLGSSSNALVAGVTAGLALAGKEVYTPIVKKLILQIAADEEGHGDNIAAAVYGGFQVNFRSGSQWITQRVPVPPGLHCVLFIPDADLERDASRSALPDYYTREDAVHNIGRAAMLINCFATGQFDALRFAMEDRLHQEYRAALFPFSPLLASALRAGAHGAFLSSQGPTVVAVCGGSTGLSGDIRGDTMSQFVAEAVSDEMLRTGQDHGIAGEVHVALPSEAGIITSGFAAHGEPLWGPEWEQAQRKR